MKNELEHFKQLVSTGSSFVLTTHLSPDCDGLGSELALAAFLKDRGKQVSIINCSETPDPYRFLDPAGSIMRFDPAVHGRILGESDVIIVADTNQPDRLAGMAGPVKASKAAKVVIDHHLDADPFADVYLIDDSSAATGEIVYKVLESFGNPRIDAEAAQALYIAIMTDTGSFRFPKTDAELHRIIAALIERGADPVAAYHKIYEQDSPQRLRLLGMALERMSTAHAGRVAYITITGEMFRETGTGEADVERFVPYTLRLRGVLIGLMFTELAGEIKVSFRSRGSIPINSLAREFGGNGHKNAAGARITGRILTDTVRQVVERSQHYLP